MTKKTKEMPKLVTISEELLEQLKFYTGTMPLREMQKIIKDVDKSAWPLKKNYKEDEPRVMVVELGVLDTLASYLRLLPLYMVGELYTMIQMGVKEYKAGKEVEDEAEVAVAPEPEVQEKPEEVKLTSNK